jgi:glycosyltransferase involved in cell wall biosynthesis
MTEDNGTASPGAGPEPVAGDESPLVSIGMPVFDGERFVGEALESLLAQDYPHFELIVSDNASQDRTEEICREYQQRDRRIRYIRQQENRGSPWNFAFVARESRGDYFLWAAHDDLWHPTFLRKCLEYSRFSSGSGALLHGNRSYRRAWRSIGALPQLQEHRNSGGSAGRPHSRPHVASRLVCHLWFDAPGILQKISLGLSVFAWDVILLLEIQLIGPNAKVPETLFTFRVAEPRNAREYAQIFKSQTVSSAMPYAGTAVHLLETVYRSTLSSSEKTQAFARFIVDCQRPPWRVTIAEELLGPNVRVDDRQFALLTGLLLNRCVPFDEIEHNALCKAILRSAMDPPDLLRIARRILSHPDPALRPLSADEAFNQ